MTCPCGCLQPVKPGNVCASRTCGPRLRLLITTKEDRSAASKHGWAKVTPEQRRARLLKSHLASQINRYEALMDRWLQWVIEQHDVRGAIEGAYRQGYKAGLLAKYRRQRNSEVAA